MAQVAITRDELNAACETAVATLTFYSPLNIAENLKSIIYEKSHDEISPLNTIFLSVVFFCMKCYNYIKE